MELLPPNSSPAEHGAMYAKLPRLQVNLSIHQLPAIVSLILPMDSGNSFCLGLHPSISTLESRPTIMTHSTGKKNETTSLGWIAQESMVYSWGHFVSFTVPVNLIQTHTILNVS